MSTVPFDKKLAELDAYLQMLIVENELLDKKLNNFSRASTATINNYEKELEGIIAIRNNLEKLLSSIKHSIVLLQIAKVSSRASFSSVAGELKPAQSKLGTPSPRSRLRSFKATSFSASKESNRNKQASRLATNNKTLDDSLSSCVSVLGARLDGNLRQDLEQQSQKQTQTNIICTERDQSPFKQGSFSFEKLALQSPSRLNHETSVLNSSSLSGTAEILLARDGSDTNGGDGGCGGRKGYTTNVCNDAVSSNGAHQTNETASPARDQDRRCAIGDECEDGNDDDDDDAFFDAADVQQNQSKATPNVDTHKDSPASLSSIRKGHPDNSQIVSTSTTTTIDYSTSRLQGTNMAETNNNIDGRLGDESIDWDALYEEEDEDELGSLEGQGSVIKHLLSQIRIGMDLTKVVLPTFILERRSLLEMYADFFAHPDLFSAIPDYNTPEERMIQLVRWYLSAFHAGRKSSLAKKPYNPILGEIFRCHWQLDQASAGQHNDNNTRSSSEVTSNYCSSKGAAAGADDEMQQLTFVAEQVSHHPPVSAFYAENKEKGISCCAHIYTKSKYLGLSVGVHNIGKGVINLHKHNETYVCTFPSAYGRSILTVPWVELGGPVTITCEQTGYKANIEFIMKPFYGGKKHRVTGEILRPNNEPILAIDGEWNGVMYSKSPPSSSGKQVFVDTTNLPVIKKHVKAVSVQDSFESRNVWKEVTRALKLKDVNSATAAKSFIEQRQRDLLKDRLEKGVKWRTRYFEPANDEGWQYAGRRNSSELDRDGAD